MEIEYFTREFRFKFPMQTSRGTMTHRKGLFLQSGKIEDLNLAEVCVIPGLSLDSLESIEELVKRMQKTEIQEDGFESLAKTHPALYFALECLILKIKTRHAGRLYFKNDFTEGKARLPINGLVWMGDFASMWRQTLQKIEQGFKCLKFKIGAQDFQLEYDFLLKVRTHFAEIAPQIRLDANGAFDFKDALPKLEQLSVLKIHSLEQPIKAGNRSEMAKICAASPIPIALDEELLGIPQKKDKADLLDSIKPFALALKPSLLGGFAQCEEWIELAEERNICWWITSALESSIGLNAIAQWAANLIFSGEGVRLKNQKFACCEYFQGLGTGEIYLNNYASSLLLRDSYLSFRQNSQSNNFFEQIQESIHL